MAVSSMLYVYLYEFDQASGQGWSVIGQGLLILGALGCLAATLSLGDCFGVLPVCRGVRVHRLKPRGPSPDLCFLHPDGRRDCRVLSDALEYHPFCLCHRVVLIAD